MGVRSLSSFLKTARRYGKKSDGGEGGGVIGVLNYHFVRLKKF